MRLLRAGLTVSAALAAALLLGVAAGAWAAFEALDSDWQEG